MTSGMNMHLVKVLVKENIISLDQIKVAIEEQRRTGKGLGEVLIDLGYINEGRLVDFLSRKYGVPSVNLDEFDIDTVVLKSVPRKTVLEHGVIPIGISGTTLVVAMSDPSDIIAIDDLRFATGYNIKPVVVPERAIRNAIERYYGTGEEKGRGRIERVDGSVEEMIRELEDFKKIVRESDEVELQGEIDSIPQGEEESPRSLKGDINTVGIFSQVYESKRSQEETIPHLEEGNPRETEPVEEVFRLFGIPLSSEGPESAGSKEEVGPSLVSVKEEPLSPGDILPQEYEPLDKREGMSPDLEPKKTEDAPPLYREDKAIEKSESGFNVPEKGILKPSDPIFEVYEAGSSSPISSHEPMWQGEEERSLILGEETPTLSKSEKEGDFKGTVLVVDNSPTVRKIVSITLERRGYRVFSAANAIQALGKLNEGIPDLILLDTGLPHMDGYRLCRFIKGNSLTKDIPVVMLSGKEGFFDRVRGHMAGAADYIEKPFEPSTLIQMVERYGRSITDR